MRMNRKQLLPSRLGVVHVPKCAGTSVRTSLEGTAAYLGPRIFDWGQVGWVSRNQFVNQFPDSTMEIFTDPVDLAAQTTDRNLVFGHFSADTLRRVGCSDLLSLIREPRSRLVSLYGYWKPHGVLQGWGVWGENVTRASEGSFAEFLRTTAVWPQTHNLVFRQHFGYSKRPTMQPPGRVEMLRLRTGYSNLGLARAFWPNESDDVLTEVRKSTGLEPSQSIKSNVTPPDLAQGQRISRQDLKLIEVLSRADTWLLERLMEDGLLTVRTRSDLDRDFERACENQGLKLP